MTDQAFETPTAGYNSPVIVEMQKGDELSELVPGPARNEPASTGRAETTPTDPEFDAYMAVVKLLIGGSIEGAHELSKRLAAIERRMRENGVDPDEPGAIENSGDIARYMLVGMTLSASDGLRRQVRKLLQASDVFWRFTGSTIDPFVENRVTGFFLGPFDRAFNRLVNRGQTRVNDWVALGRAQEPPARLAARVLTLEVIDDFISHLSENEELASLVQEQSISLATETVDEIRSRTVSADAIAEGIVRRILRRPPRLELPPPPEALIEAVADQKERPRKG